MVQHYSPKTTLNPKGLMTDFSKKERSIINLISEGLLDKEIAIKLGLTVETVKSYQRRVRKKCDLLGLDSHTRVRLAKLVWEEKI